ncbi:DnaJ-domain-containing protein [Meira miltonrushii]|uniref:DnaJ-domain-containing protein n=1 Tax=Meira miltonrushii TaxID=1280837 RepID=A0A316VKD4_9BASI|nr:DnaJ-domain-containing protein [Meira miltonrushii]PWN37980.1 DnaJ-domain-containing protein [Meira miltonrushii]
MAIKDEVDYFAVMGLKPSASEAEIRRAHKKLSLALHPDKNRHMDPAIAAARFSEMQLAYEILMDPSARIAAAERNKAETARKERQGAYEGKRKAMAEELEKRETEEHEKRMKTMNDERRRRETLERLREEGKQLREKHERKKNAETSKKEQEEQERDNHPINRTTESPEPELGPLDLTVRLKFPSDLYGKLRGSIQSDKSSETLKTPLAKGLVARFGKLEALVFRPMKEGKRESSALATFKTLDAAFASVKAGSQFKAGGAGAAEVLEDVWIEWAASKKGGKSEENGSSTSHPGEPARIAWLRKHGKLSEGDENARHTKADAPNKASEENILTRMRASSSNNGNGQNSSNGSHSSASRQRSSINESDILQRMRDAEKKRQEEAILQADAE